MLKPNVRLPWAGSLAFVVASTALAYASATLFLPASVDATVIARRLFLALVVGLLGEVIRRAKLAEVGREVTNADERVKVEVSVNGVQVGELSELAYGQARLAAANDPRNYVAQAGRLAVGLWRHGMLAFAWTAFIVAAWLVITCLLTPDEFARDLIAYAASPASRFGHATALATALHDVAQLLAWSYGTVFVIAAGVRMQFGAPLSILGAFRADVERRVRLIVGTTADGNLSLAWTGRR